MCCAICRKSRHIRHILTSGVTRNLWVMGLSPRSQTMRKKVDLLFVLRSQFSWGIVCRKMEICRIFPWSQMLWGNYRFYWTVFEVWRTGIRVKVLQISIFLQGGTNWLHDFMISWFQVISGDFEIMWNHLKSIEISLFFFGDFIWFRVISGDFKWFPSVKSVFPPCFSI